MNEARVGIVAVWGEGDAAGVGGGISTGTHGMRFSLKSLGPIADSVETVMGGHGSPSPRGANPALNSPNSTSCKSCLSGRESDGFQSATIPGERPVMLPYRWPTVPVTLRFERNARGRVRPAG